MANAEHVKLLQQGVESWNQWRRDHPDEQIDLGKADLKWADLNGANLRDVDLRETCLIRAYLGGADLHKASLMHTNLSEAILYEANLSGADLSEANLSRANLHGGNLRKARLRNADFSGANLSCADLSGGDCSHANLYEADLYQAILSYANLEEAYLGGANLREANLTKAILQQADFHAASLVRANLCKAALTGVMFYGARRDEWLIDEITCDYVFWDALGIVRFPKHRNFTPGEFERLYRHVPSFAHYFDHSVTPLDAFVIAQLVQTINTEHPEWSLQLERVYVKGQPYAVFTVFHQEDVESAKKAVSTLYEALFGALGGKQEQLLNMMTALVASHCYASPEHVNETPVSMKAEFQMAYNVLNQKLFQRRQTYIFETVPLLRFTLEKQIEQAEADLIKIHQRLKAVFEAEERKASGERQAR